LVELALLSMLSKSLINLLDTPRSLLVERLFIFIARADYSGNGCTDCLKLLIIFVRIVKYLIVDVINDILTDCLI
jgi:hypothetical protein